MKFHGIIRCKYIPDQGEGTIVKILHTFWHSSDILLHSLGTGSHAPPGRTSGMHKQISNRFPPFLWV